MGIQLYVVTILAQQLQTGRRPTKRMNELLHFYAQAMVSETELIVGLKTRVREADLARESFAHATWPTNKATRK